MLKPDKSKIRTDEEKAAVTKQEILQKKEWFDYQHGVVSDLAGASTEKPGNTEYQERLRRQVQEEMKRHLIKEEIHAHPGISREEAEEQATGAAATSKLIPELLNKGLEIPPETDFSSATKLSDYIRRTINPAGDIVEIRKRVPIESAGKTGEVADGTRNESSGLDDNSSER